MEYQQGMQDTIKYQEAQTSQHWSLILQYKAQYIRYQWQM